jgi:hypothetical protein
LPRRDRPAAQARAPDRLRGFAKDAVEICATASVPLRANGQSAIAYYSEDKETGRFSASAIDVLIALPPELAPDLT